MKNFVLGVYMVWIVDMLKLNPILIRIWWITDVVLDNHQLLVSKSENSHIHSDCASAELQIFI